MSAWALSVPRNPPRRIAETQMNRAEHEKGALADQDEAWETTRLSIPREMIGYLASLLEAYDNHFTVRTETKGIGIILVWYPAVYREMLDRILTELNSEFPTRILSRKSGMVGLDEVFPA